MHIRVTAKHLFCASARQAFPPIFTDIHIIYNINYLSTDNNANSGISLFSIVHAYMNVILTVDHACVQIIGTEQGPACFGSTLPTWAR